MTSLARLPGLSRLALIGAVAAATSGAAFADDLTVTLTGVHAGGQIMGALQTEAQFLQPAMSYGAIAPSKDGAVVLTFKDVAPGVYSVSVLQDEDGNQTMTLDAKGRPAEGWAMKNGAKMRGAPTWADARFTVEAKPMAFTEPMIYPKK